MYYQKIKVLFFKIFEIKKSIKYFVDNTLSFTKKKEIHLNILQCLTFYYVKCKMLASAKIYFGRGKHLFFDFDFFFTKFC